MPRRGHPGILGITHFNHLQIHSHPHVWQVWSIPWCLTVAQRGHIHMMRPRAGNSSPVSCLEWLWFSGLVTNHKFYILLTALSFAFIMWPVAHWEKGF